MADSRFLTQDDAQTDRLTYGARHWFCRPEITGSRHLLVGRVCLAPGAVQPFHRHVGREQFLSVVSGTAEQWIDEEQRFLRSGQAAFVPVGVVHATFNPGEEPLEILEVSSPADVAGPFAEDVSALEPWKTLTKQRGYRYVKVWEEADVSVARMLLSSIVESSNVARIDAELQRLASEGQRRKLVVDFRDVEFMSSTVLALLVRLQQRVGDAGGRLRLCGVREQLMEVFRVTRLDRKLSLFGSLSEALQDF